MHPLQKLLEDAGYTTCSYSGRGMYGKKCLGVTIKNGGYGNFMADMIESVCSLDDSGEINEISQATRSMRSDSMGLDEIVYFKDVEYSTDWNDDEEDEDNEKDNDDETKKTN